MSTQVIEYKSFKTNFAIFIAGLLFLMGVFVSPPIFGSLFSMGELKSEEVIGLWIFTGFVFLLGIIISSWRTKIGIGASMVVFTILLLVYIELIFRIIVLIFASDVTVEKLEWQNKITYREESAYQGHPFIQFTGRPSIVLKGSQALKGDSPFNNFGFVGNDFDYYKPPNVVRIVCLGESTTADGYPAHLDKYLEKNIGSLPYRFQVYNFGHAHWTSAHSLVNFVLNILDFNPDFVILHHGWNEDKVRNVPSGIFRNDYSHIFHSFSEPFVYDRYLIRISSLYRYIKFKFDQSPLWASLAGAMQYEVERTPTDYSDLRQLKPFERNLKTIVRMARSQGSEVFIATLPRTTDSTKSLFFAYKNIDQCNEISRKICDTSNNDIHLVDLANAITGKRNDIFIDLAHVNNVGRDLKAQMIGDSLLNFIRSNEIGFKPHFNFDGDYYDGIQYYRKQIFTNKDWLDDVTKKSKTKNIPIDSMATLDAIYMINEDLKIYNNQ